MTLTDFRTLGRSGLIVSPLTLGTMTFGRTDWGASDEASEALFNTYADAGGNSVDTANVYSNGRSEELLGKFIADRCLRDRIVLATKFAFSTEDGNPNAAGNGRKHIHQALDASLRRLQTDTIDLYWLHVWDSITPAEEVLQTLVDLVRAGKIRYFALSDVPAWYATRMATLAAAHGVPGPIALQMEYSLVERAVEREHVPAAKECGLGIMPWSPLAGGFLTGKYQRTDGGGTGEGRLSGPNPFGQTKFTDSNWRTLDALKAVAGEMGRPPAQVALAWVAAQPGITSIILGAGKQSQLEDNIASQEIVLTSEQLKTLREASASAPSMYDYLSADMTPIVFGTNVQGQD